MRGLRAFAVLVVFSLCAAMIPLAGCSPLTWEDYVVREEGLASESGYGEGVVSVVYTQPEGSRGRGASGTLTIMFSLSYPAPGSPFETPAQECLFRGGGLLKLVYYDLETPRHKLPPVGLTQVIIYLPFSDHGVEYWDTCLRMSMTRAGGAFVDWPYVTTLEIGGFCETFKWDHDIAPLDAYGTP